MARTNTGASFGALLEQNRRQRQGGVCSITTILGKMPAADAAMLRKALADRETYSAPGIARALAAAGFKVGHNAVQRHRTGACRCE